MREVHVAMAKSLVSLPNQKCAAAGRLTGFTLQDTMEQAGRLVFPLPMFAYPFYLFQRSPGKQGSHFDPECDLFKSGERRMVLTSNAFLAAMAGILTFCTLQLGPLAMFKLYLVPYWVNVVWLDIVTYLHHHGSSDREEQLPWYRCALLCYGNTFAIHLRSAAATSSRSTGTLMHQTLWPATAAPTFCSNALHSRIILPSVYSSQAHSRRVCRGEEWSYLRGGLTALDRDYGIFNKIHHDIGTHVIHHLFPQIPHYNLEKATEACKPVMGPYYRDVEPAPGLLPTHLIEPLVRSFNNDHYVDDEGDIVYYKKSSAIPALFGKGSHET